MTSHVQEVNFIVPVWTSSGDVGGVRVTEDMAGSLVEAGTWWTPKQVVEQWDAPTVLGAGMSVWGTRTKHAGYTIRTPAAKKEQVDFMVIYKKLTFKIINEWTILPVTPKFIYPFYPLKHYPWTRSPWCNPITLGSARHRRFGWMNKKGLVCVYI